MEGIMDSNVVQSTVVFTSDTTKTNPTIYMNGTGVIPQDYPATEVPGSGFENDADDHDKGSPSPDLTSSTDKSQIIFLDSGSTQNSTAVEGQNFATDEGEHGSKANEDVPKCVECTLSTGELLSCGGCGLIYHKECLLRHFVSKPESDTWQCPQCEWKLTAGALQSDAVASNVDYSDDSNNLNSLQYDNPPASMVVEEGTGSVPIVGDSTSFNNKCGKDMKTVRGLASPTRDGPIDTVEKKRKKPTTEGSNYATKINIGYSHQVPFTPAFFLDDSYDKPAERYEWARLMYSPFQLERIRCRKLQEGCYDNVIKNEFELAEFIQLCAKSWKNSPGWHPFSPEFAYKILHFADYDPKRALKLMNDPNFNFTCVCDPPTRRYDNKWKPKDRRGQVPTSPYPPPVTLRGYLLRRHNMGLNRPQN